MKTKLAIISGFFCLCSVFNPALAATVAQTSSHTPVKPIIQGTLCPIKTMATISSWDGGKTWCVGMKKKVCYRERAKAARKACNKKAKK